MYLWKVDSLVEDLKHDRVSQKEELKYMLCLTILTTIFSDSFLNFGAPYNSYDTILSALNLGVSMAGVFYCYKINASADDKDFIVRMICIGLPVTIRVLAVLVPIVTIGVTLEASLNPESTFEIDEPTETTLTTVILDCITVIGWYWYLSTKIRAVSVKNS